MSIVIDGTPLMEYDLPGGAVYVKREDLCCPYPGPMFSKIRGVAAHIAKREEPIIGALDTYHSKAGWAVAYVCRRLNKRAVVYWPKYKADAEAKSLPRRPQREAAAEGATTVALKAGRSSVIYHAARQHLRKYDRDWSVDRPGTEGVYMMPNALKLPETITETANEVDRTLPHLPEGMADGTLVISVSSGTIASGVLAGFDGLGIWPNVILHQGYSRPEEALLKYMDDMAGGALAEAGFTIQVVDEGYRYKDRARQGVTVEFPANPYYDLKAWRWLARHREELAEPVLFWNIGA